MKKHFTRFDFFVALILVFFSFVCLVPLINTIAISFSDRTSAASGQVYFWPKNFTLAAYQKLLQDNQYFVSFAVSVVRVIVGVGVMLLVSVPLSYALSKSTETFKARNVYMWMVVFTMLFNGGLVATYIWIKTIGMLDTMWALTLPWGVPVFSVIVLMNYMKGIAKEIEEAAMIDGSNPFSTLIRIIIPLSMPAIATVSLLSIVGHWNDYFTGRIYINSMSKMPLQTYLYALTAEISASAFVGLSPEEIVAKLKVSSLTFNCAKVVIATIPVLVIYPYLQKYFVKGLVMGAVKG